VDLVLRPCTYRHTVRYSEQRRSRDERLIQLNQRVPFVSDIVVKRPDTNRPVAKRDVDEFLRRLVPFISLHVASNVAAIDGHDHVETIAVNSWCRYFERQRTEGRARAVRGIREGRHWKS
jgi:hypothetical protein